MIEELKYLLKYIYFNFIYFFNTFNNFKYKKDNNVDLIYDLRASYVEIYNETLKDLLYT